MSLTVDHGAFERAFAEGLKLVDGQRYPEAIACFEAALALRPASPEALFNLARTLQLADRTDEALPLYRKVTTGPLRLNALANVGVLSPGEIGPADEALMARAAAAPNLEATFASQVGFALGAVRDHQGRYDEAFAAYAEANRRRAAGFDLAAVEAREVAKIDRIRRAFTPDVATRWRGRGHASAAPIFVVGWPRSGSTLIEQILASHPDAQGMGELDVLDLLIGERVDWLEFAGAADDFFQRLGGQYLKSVKAAGWAKKPRFVDKMLANHLFVGFVALAFPRAVILHSLREPADTCLSWHLNFFTAANELSYDLGAAGRSYARYRRLMAHWEALLPGRVIAVRNEALVADPEAQIRWLVTEACGLSWNPACLRFYENRRRVDTASRLQVRQPIFASSVGRWRRYRKHLGPLFEALGPYAPAEA